MSAESSDTDALVAVRDLVRWGASRFREAGLNFGHGTENALDEAFHLVLHALHLPSDLPAVYLEGRVTPAERVHVLALLRRRIETRKPAAYLVGEIDFAGIPFTVDERVLVPRSPIAELIEAGFAPWLAEPPGRILDLCAGSGCIGIACAVHLGADVDLGEIDAGALEVCATNIERHGVGDRVRAIQSDLFARLQGEQYDLIVSNPPYVPAAEYARLAPEYHQEPRRALEAGVDGMDIVARILREAPAHLAPGGALICEIGGSQAEFEARWPDLPVTWIEFQRGGDGVFLIGRDELPGVERGMKHDPAGHHHHHHGHAHTHGEAAHGHDPAEETDHAHPVGAGTSKRLHAALALTTVVMLVEAVGGWWTHSLALLADAGHMLADAGSLLLAVLAIRQARRPADTLHSYGHGRFLVLAAFVNGLLLLAVSAWISIEAVLRLVSPAQVDGKLMAGIAMIGLVANLVAFAFLHGGHEHDLNRRSAAAHVVSDLLGSIAALAAAGVIVATGWMRADPLLSLLAAALIVRTGIRVTRESAHVLLEGAPPGMNLARVMAELPRAVSGVASVHHLHAWSLTPGDNLMTLHAVLTPAADVDDTLAGIKVWLQETYRIGHITVQIEREVCAADPACAADARQ